MTIEGPEFINAAPGVVTGYLENRVTNKININPSDLHIRVNGRHLKLGVGRSGEEYPVRTSFLKKLLRWHSFPAALLPKLSPETIASVCNDYLLQIRSNYVTVTLEGEDALTITSPGYNEITDLEIINRLASLNLRHISRNDYMLRVTTEDKYKFQPVKGDDCGIGICVVNSETGFRALSVYHFIIRYICTNGAMSTIGQEASGKIHYGNPANELTRFLNEQVENAEHKKEELNANISRLTSVKACDNKALVNRIKKILGRKEVEITEQTTLYDLFNLVTEKAKQFDLSKRIYLESLAGEMTTWMNG